MDKNIKGTGIINGLLTTLKHFADTYLDDLKWGKNRYKTAEGIQHRSSTDVKGIFTIQYPEEKLPVPEEFRYLPVLLYETDENNNRKYRCTACGICAKVCPPQCIWIVRDVNPKTGRPSPNPKEFYIDVDICMNCGFCAEYCPFDSIKMDHNYEIASYERMQGHIFTLEKLARPVEYYAQIRPVNYARETEARAARNAARN